MTTDWILMRRVAVELDRALRGGRVADVGLLEDGRFALRVGSLRGRPDAVLAVDAFGSPPLATLSTQEISPAADPGWTRAIAAALRGMRVNGVRPRPGDRVLVVSLATHSRFGVANEVRLVLELVPRFGNVLVVRDRTIVAAAKQFSPAENETRSIQAGNTYQPPPLPAPLIDRAAFVAALGGDARAQVKALGAFRPDLPRLLAESLVAQAAAISWPSARALAEWLETKATGIIDSTTGESDGLGDVHAYYDGRRTARRRPRAGACPVRDVAARPRVGSLAPPGGLARRRRRGAAPRAKSSAAARRWPAESPSAEFRSMPNWRPLRPGAPTRAAATLCAHQAMHSSPMPPKSRRERRRSCRRRVRS